MATVFAKQAGSWTDTTLWAFWNETTQQSEDYGQVPQNGDIVYCNGYNVAIPTVLDIGSGILSNGTNPYTGRVNGIFTCAATSAAVNITANLEGVNGNVISFSGNQTQGAVFNGNFLSNYGVLLNSMANQQTATINGNVKGQFIQTSYAGNFTYYININGNWENGAHIEQTRSSYNVVINGVCFASINPVNNLSLTSFSVNGIMYIIDDYIVRFTIKINGKIDVTQSNVNFFPSVSTIQFLGESEIVTKAADYPSPEDVRKNITYDFGDMVGTMEQTIQVLSQQLISRLENCATVETVQQLLVAHLDN